VQKDFCCGWQVSSVPIVFRIRDGKIAEEWVSRDELGMLMQLGVVAASR
jgi:hypothetical protein